LLFLYILLNEIKSDTHEKKEQQLLLLLSSCFEKGIKERDKYNTNYVTPLTLALKSFESHPLLVRVDKQGEGCFFLGIEGCRDDGILSQFRAIHSKVLQHYTE